jgi:sarcosine oxidase subunit gamma
MAEDFVLDALGCSVAERHPSSVYILRIRRPDGALIDRIGALLRTPLPTQANHAAGTAPRVFWRAPGEWMLTGAEAVTPAIDHALAGVTAHLADMTQACTIFRAAGPAARDCLSMGTGIDLHPRTFAEGRCARTLFADTPVLIDRVPGTDAFDLYTDIGFADHLRRWFAEALREFKDERP